MLSTLRSSLARWLMPPTERRRFDLSQLADDDVWEEIFGESHGSDAGERITSKSALSIAPVWAAVSMISGGCAKIPPKIYKRRSPGPGKDVDYSHQVSQFIDPDELANDETTSIDLFRRWFASAALWNNGYIWADWSPSNELLGLYNLCPDRTTLARIKGKLWCLTEVNGQLEPLHYEDVLHLRGLHVVEGAAPELVQQARHDFGLQLAARKFTSKFFKNGAHLGGVLQVPPGYKETVRKKIEKALEEQRTGTDKAFKTFVMRDGYKFFSTSVDPQKAQTIELNDEKRRDVANWFCMAPSRLGVKESVSYNSLETDKQDFYDTTLSNWIVPAQAQLNTKLRTRTERRSRSHVIRYQFSALLLADTKTRNEIAVTGINAGRFSPDETRGWEDLNPRDDGEGDKFLRPLNMTVAGEDPPPPGDPPTTPPPDPQAADRAAQLRSGLQALLKSTVRRIGKRLQLHAERAEKRQQLATWLTTFEDEHRAVIVEMLDDVMPAINAAGMAESATSRAVADMLAAAVRNQFVNGKPDQTLPDTLAELAAGVFLPEPSDDDN